MDLHSLGRLVCLYALAAGSALGQSRPAPTTAPDWSQETKPERVAAVAAIPHKILLVQDLTTPQVPTFVAIDSQQFNIQSFMELMSPEDARQTYLINDVPYPAADENSRTYNAMHILAPDLLIVARYDGRPWQIITMTDKQTAILAEAPGPAGVASDPGKLVTWILRSLAYDGVVVGVKDDLVLVAGSADRVTTMTNGAVLKYSDKGLAFTSASPEALVFMTKTRSWGIFAEFRLLPSAEPGEAGAVGIRGTAAIPIGSKVVVQ